MSILTAGDSVGGKIFAGTPDGMGTADLGDGTILVTLNHEFAATSGSVRAHGSVGAFVSRIIIDRQTLAVRSLDDLGQVVHRDLDGDGIYVLQTTAFGRFCSADVAAVGAFYNPLTGKGTTERLHLTGEETGPEGRAFAFIATGAEAGNVYELPTMGNLSYENLVASPASGDKTVVIMQDDARPGQLYMYLGDKQSDGASAVEKAGLLNGLLYGIKVQGLTLESDATTLQSAPFSFELIDNARTQTGAQIQATSVAKGVTEFLRPEDGAWDPANPNWYYFNTTNGTTNPSRLWRLELIDVRNPLQGGVIRMMLDGSEGQRMLDNMTIDANGKVYVQEDPGGNARLAKIWMYDPTLDRLTELAAHDPARFTVGGSQFLTQDEESSGIIDVTTLLGGPDRQAFLLASQAHHGLPAPVVSGGQLMAMFVDRPVNGGTGDDLVRGSAVAEQLEGGAGKDTILGGSGNDSLHGGSGSDALSGAAGDDALIGDGPVMMTAIAQSIRRLYIAALDRSPDDAGWQGWIAQRENGRTLGEIAGGFVNAQEFQQKYGALTNAAFVRQLYLNVLDREPDAGGLAAYTDALDRNQLSRTQVLVSFSESTEFVTNTSPVVQSGQVFRLYGAAMNRLPDVGGFLHWTEHMDAGRGLPAVASGFLGSAEGEAIYGGTTSAQFVGLLYRNVLQRTPDAAGLASWTSLLDSNAQTRAQVVTGFSESAEYSASTRAGMMAFLRSGILAGADTLAGGDGNDALSGGSGADHFVFAATSAGNDSIFSLESHDVLELSGFGFADSAAALAAITQRGNDQVLSFTGGEIVFVDTEMSVLREIGPAGWILS